jgi:hypothetical protein
MPWVNAIDLRLPVHRQALDDTQMFNARQLVSYMQGLPPARDRRSQTVPQRRPESAGPSGGDRAHPLAPAHRAPASGEASRPALAS